MPYYFSSAPWTRPTEILNWDNREAAEREIAASRDRFQRTAASSPA
jgi:hypothetical protein